VRSAVFYMSVSHGKCKVSQKSESCVLSDQDRRHRRTGEECEAFGYMICPIGPRVGILDVNTLVELALDCTRSICRVAC